MAYLALVSGAVLLVSAWIGVRAEMSARRYFPSSFADELSSRYFMQYVLFDRTIPLEIRRRFVVSSALSMVSFAGFTAVAYLSNNPVIAVLLILICGYAVANVVVQSRRSGR